MNRRIKFSIVTQILICMAISLAINAYVGHRLKASLSGGNYTLEVRTLYPAKGGMQLFYDTGSDFNIDQQVSLDVERGPSTLRFPFQLKEGEQLKHIRLDFGSDPELKEVTLHSVGLSNNAATLFVLQEENINRNLGLLVCLDNMDKSPATFSLDTRTVPFDPYVVFAPVNELVYPKWQRTLLLVVPWLALLLLPLLSWLKQLKTHTDYKLIFIGLFLVAIPLKIAWVTFSSLLMLAYAFFEVYKKRQLKFGPIQLSLVVFFAVPLLFIGEGNFSKLAIPLGFMIFALIGASVDFTNSATQIKKMYIMVYFIVMSISIVNWLLLIFYNGYYYNIGFASYFIDIKNTAHILNSWLYYPHTTFLSFFMLIGVIFCYDCYQRKEISRKLAYSYTLFCIITLALLGSRFSLLMLFLLPFLIAVPLKTLGKTALPMFAVIATALVYFIDVVDSERMQLWYISWEVFKENIWLGHGTGMSEPVLQNLEQAQRAGFNSVLARNHSHNQFLTYLLENGILGTFLFVCAYLFMGYHYIRKGNKTMLLVTLLVALLMLIESPFRTTTSLYMIAFLFTVFSSLPQKNPGINPQ